MNKTTLIMFIVFFSVPIISAIIGIIIGRRKNKEIQKKEYQDSINKVFEKINESKIKEIQNEEYEDSRNKVLKKTNTYSKKKSIISSTEKKIYVKINRIIENTNYLLQAQVNLASIVDKNSDEKFRSELFRNIDFGIFDKYTFEPLVMIELNDTTHKQKERIIRDIKVKNILNQAEIPLITLHTEYENEENYIRRRLADYINV